LDPLEKYYPRLNPKDPVDRCILYQYRSLNFENLKDIDKSRYPPSDSFENKLIGAYDAKYHPNELDEDREKEILEWWELGMRQADLASMIKKSQSTVSRWLHKIKASI